MILPPSAGLRRLCAILLLGAVATCGARAASNEIVIPGDHTYPESITGTSDGTLYIGSLGDGGVFRVAPGASTAEPFIAKGASGLLSVIGILADERTGTLWVCSSDLSGLGLTIPTGRKPTALWSFDLKSGSTKGSVPLPGEKQFCNDMAIGK